MDLPTSISGTMALFPETKEQQNDFVEKLIGEVTSGNFNPLQAEARIVNLESVCKKYRADKRIKEAVLNEAEKYHKDELQSLYNAKFQIKEVGVKYDFSECGYLRYNELCRHINSLLEDKKELESEMKAKKESWIYVDKITGETYEVFPPTKTSTTSVTVEIL